MGAVSTGSIWGRQSSRIVIVNIPSERRKLNMPMWRLCHRSLWRRCRWGRSGEMEPMMELMVWSFREILGPRGAVTFRVLKADESKSSIVLPGPKPSGWIPEPPERSPSPSRWVPPPGPRQMSSSCCWYTEEQRATWLFNSNFSPVQVLAGWLWWWLWVYTCPTKLKKNTFILQTQIHRKACCCLLVDPSAEVTARLLQEVVPTYLLQIGQRSV